MGFVILEPEESVGYISVGMALKEKQDVQSPHIPEPATHSLSR